MHSKAEIAELARKHLDRRLTPLRQPAVLARPPRGWIKAIREALGMTTTQLGERMSISQTRVSRIEKDEVGSAVTLRTLRQAAEAMDCTLVYVLVPNEPLEQIVRHRAAAITNERLARSHHAMKLENQALAAPDLDGEHKRIFRELLEGDPRRLWSST